jgi:RNA polymerase sigma-70 factor (ECF subfamily)
LFFISFFDFVVGFHCDKARNSDQSDHLSWIFWGKASACREFRWVISYREELMDEPSVSPHKVTQLLQRWSQGDDSALAELTPLVYEELHRLAHHYMEGERPNHTLQTTALVSEAYLRLIDQTNPNWQSRAHFFAVAARAMRQILVSYARSSRAQKRGGGGARVELDEAAILSPEQSNEIVDVHEALEKLATLDERKAQVVELKYFGGLNHDEIAEVLKISTITVRRDWVFAKTWLYDELQSAH